MLGVATTICQPNEFIIPDSAVVGDVLVLTKPLGTQVRDFFFMLIISGFCRPVEVTSKHLGQYFFRNILR